MRTYKLEQFEELKTEFDRISENGRKNPEEVLEAFKNLHSTVAFCVAPHVEMILSKIGDRKTQLEFYRFCFNQPSFDKLNRDDRMRRNLETNGFKVLYEGHEPVDIIDPEVPGS